MTSQTTLENVLPAIAEPAKTLLIGGKWCAARSGKTLPSVNPTTGETIAQISAGGREDVDLAVGAARDAFEGEFGRFSPVDRQRAMLRLADLIERDYASLRRVDAVDMGMPMGSGEPDGTGAAEVLRYFAGWTTKIYGDTVPNSLPGRIVTETLREPVGVVGAIIPWNGPLLAIMWKLAPALATGCTLVLKPAEEASLSALGIGRLVEEAGFPPGTVNIVTGLGETAGAALTEHRGVDKISFTASVATGRRILQAAGGNMKRLSLEMGGKSPDVIFEDADLDRAVPTAAMAVFFNTGQVCVAGTRIFVARSIYEEVSARIAEFSRSLTVGDPLDPATMIGPVVSARQLDVVSRYLKLGQQEGASLLSGGNRLTDGELGKGYFVPPTVFSDVTDEMTIAREEIFGPVASILPFDSEEEEVVSRANATSYGLGGAVWTRDGSRAQRVVRSLRAGTVWVNTYLQVDPGMPFGGYKESGWGTDIGRQSLESYLNTKAVYIDIQ
jgi:aldehyde dehydrogenase (NAD+)